ncbi:hypothetical protein V1498_15930 [Peribacillus sp. SCS-26]|uniref:hypothetical protein n=1 Tax=Paraperibacillus marinus TaxID=3115295 RepID=UPI003905AF72
MFRKTLLPVFLLFLLAACQQEESKQPKKEEKKASKQEVIASADHEPMEAEYYELPDTARPLTEQEKKLLRKPGIFSGDKYEEAKVNTELDKLPDDLTDEQYLEEMLHLLAEDYHKEIETFANFDSSVIVDIDRPDEKIDNPALKKTHYAILIDASGSMNGKAGSSTKMAAAKEAALVLYLNSDNTYMNM